MATGADMALIFEVVEFEFLPEKFTPGEGQLELIGTVGFEGQQVQKATAALQGFDLRYNGSTDHHILQETVWVEASPSPLGVNVTCRILLRDGSGNIDDPFIGKVNVVVIAETA